MADVADVSAHPPAPAPPRPRGHARGLGGPARALGVSLPDREPRRPSFSADGDTAPLSDPTKAGVLLALVNVTLFSAMSLAQWAGWGGPYSAVREALTIMGINLGFGLFVVAGSFALRPMRLRGWRRHAAIAVAALIASLPRAFALEAAYSTPSGSVYFVAEWLSGLLAGFVAVSAGVLTASHIFRARDELSRRLHEARRATRAIEELQTEEVRVRRKVSDQLHGTLQYRLVTVTAGLDGIAARLSRSDPAAAAEVHAWAERLEEIREVEVRALSHSVFPAGVELGVARAIEAMLVRLPLDIATSVEVGPGYRELTAQACGDALLSLTERLAAVYTVEEAVSNALRHGRATSLHIWLEATPTNDRTRWVLEVAVDDNGTGLARPDPELTGLRRHAERLESSGGSLMLTSGPLGGARLAFTLPFRFADATGVGPRDGHDADPRPPPCAGARLDA